MLQFVLPELLVRMVVRVIPLWFRRDDVIQQFALPVLLTRFGVGLGHGDGLAKRTSSLGEDHDHSCTWWRFQDQLPFLSREIRLRGHRRSPISRNRHL